MAEKMSGGMKIEDSTATMRDGEWVILGPPLRAKCCDATPLLVVNYPVSGLAFVVCQKCGRFGADGKFQVEAIEKWNEEMEAENESNR